jgi:hypothetical protein
MVESCMLLHEGYRRLRLSRRFAAERDHVLVDGGKGAPQETSNLDWANTRIRAMAAVKSFTPVVSAFALLAVFVLTKFRSPYEVVVRSSRSRGWSLQKVRGGRGSVFEW